MADLRTGSDTNVTAVPAPLSTTGGGTEAASLRVTVATDSTGVLSVDDNGASLTVDNGGTFPVQIDAAALTSLALIDDMIYIDDTATHATGTSKGSLIMAAATPTDSAVDANDIGAIAMTTDRKLHVAVMNALPAGTAAIGKSAANDGVDIGDVTINNATGASAVNIQDGGNTITVDQATASNLNATVVGTGTLAVQVDGNALTSLQLIDDIVYTDDTSTHATGTSKGGLIMAAAVPTDASVNANDIGAVAMTTDRKLHVAVMDALPAGTAAIGKLAANSGIDIGDVDVTSISAGTNAIGNIGVIPRTTGGLTPYHLVSAASTNATVVKASAGQLFGWFITNTNAAARKIAFHNASSTPTAGASIFFSLFIPALGAANVMSDIGIAFGTGISITTVTGIADNDSAAVALNDLVINLFYA